MSEYDPLVHYIICGPDGKIRQSGDCARSMLPVYAGIYGEGFAAVEVPADQYDRDIDVHCYVFNAIITAKGIAASVTAYTIKADGNDAVSFSVPAGTSVIHNGQIVALSDDAFSFTTDDVGDFEFSFIAPAAFRDFKVTIHAV
ncbi:hypothetical protein [Rhizobium mayense]|uniref:Uncharacterized protein n=1 Tax=Rhizobium mayense TaxID=1312184 RepID=A0ABT7JM94_9HYPH|nr:hypothetical protein [Rhizobium mayense]MDL2397471.1 hypothetical protein [Rhizobium mayense]